jgi:hypothetical protein
MEFGFFDLVFSSCMLPNELTDEWLPWLGVNLFCEARTKKLKPGMEQMLSKVSAAESPLLL